jgi:hypothetical protein
MSNMGDITKKHNTEIYKDEQQSLYISVFCFAVVSMLLIFIYFCVMFFGDVDNVAHPYIFLCYVFGDVNVAMADITKKHSTEIYIDEQHGHHQKA